MCCASALTAAIGRRPPGDSATQGPLLPMISYWRLAPLIEVLMVAAITPRIAGASKQKINQ
jgi:hypothetical protein